MSGPLGNHIMPSHEFYQQQQQQTQRPPVRRPDKSHNQEIMRKNDHALAPNLPGRSPGGDARMKGTVFANAARGLTGDNIRKLTSYWQRTITETEENEHDFKSHALPLARIKKVMKADEDVKMISAEAPILFAKACEIFINELTRRAWIHAEENKRRTLQRSDIANAISRSDMFDFLIDIVPRDEFVAQGVAEAGPDAQPVVGAAGGFMGMPLGHAVQPHPGAHIVQQDHQRHSPNEGYYPQHKQEGAPMNGHYQPTQQSMHQHPQHRQPLLAQHHAMQQDPSQQQQQQQQQQPAHHLLPQHTMYEQQRYSMPHSAMPPMGNSHPAYLDHMGYHPGYGQHNPMNQPYGNPYSHPYVTQQHPPPPHQHREGEVDVSNAHYGHR